MTGRGARLRQAFAAFARQAWPAALALALFSLLLLSVGRSPVATLSAILEGAFGTAEGVRETLTRTIPVLLCALATAVPARAGLNNIGGEGQLHAGAVGASAVALFATTLSGWLMLPSMIAAAALAGAALAGVAGLLRAYLGVSEVLSGLMLNYVGVLLVEHLVHGPWRDPSALGWAYSALFPESAVLPRFGDSNVHLGLLMALAGAVILAVLWRTTSWALATRVIGDNPIAARAVGISVPGYLVALLCLGGAFAALAGMGEVSVVQGRLRGGLSPGYGYTGFVVSWLAGHRFLALVPVAVVVAGLYSGADALQLTAGLPAATTDILMALVFLSFLLRAGGSRLDTRV